MQMMPLQTYELYLRALYNVKIFKSTDPRDKIFAIARFFNVSVVPDYFSNVQWIYTQLALEFIETADRGFDILLQAGRHQQSLENMPSWVPDWSSEPVFDFFGAFGIREHTEFRITRELRGEISASVR
jgi:hypothetical protein